jgi:alanyl-tRNA synthetase
MPAKKTWTSARVREQYLKYFETHGHRIMPSSPLVPYNDPTVFFTVAGMQQMVPYFLGVEPPPVQRMTSSQKCFRTNDIDSVGDDRHLTFFEMLGNFSVGDYFKREAIQFAWELLTVVYGLDPARLYPSIYPTDEEALQYWIEVAGIPSERIARLEDNWWDRGETVPGPAGPDSEIYYDRGEEHGCGRETCQPGCDCERFLEIWNLVFMQYNQDGKGGREPLVKKNIDTGMGLERLLLLLQDKKTVFETDLFQPIISKFAQIAGTMYGKDQRADRSLRVIADHGRALVFLAADGVLPSNEGRGYIFRRVLRRAVRHGKLLGLEKPFLSDAADTVIELMAGHYPELREQRDRIVDVLSLEERKFSQTLSTGLQLLDAKLSELKESNTTVFAGADAFALYDTHGFPLELTLEVVAEHGLTVDEGGFRKAMEQQRERSKHQEGLATEREGETWKHFIATMPPTLFTGYQTTKGSAHVVGLFAEGQSQEMLTAPQDTQPTEITGRMAIVLDTTPFYAESGGQIGDQGWIRSTTGTFQVLDTQRPANGVIVHYGLMTDGYLKMGSPVETEVNEQRREDTRRNHSATHLLHRALKNLLGEQVVQRGSLVEPERLRFDFNFQRALTTDEIEAIDLQVNEWIRPNQAVNTEMLPLEQAKHSGAMALFGEKYPDPVRVVTMGTSKELCGGTHVTATGQIGVFVITQETSNAAGIRRIEALTGRAAVEYLMNRKRVVDTLAAHLQTSPDTLEQRVDQLITELTVIRKEQTRTQREILKTEAEQLLADATTVQGHSVVAASVKAPGVEALREMSDHLRTRLGSGVILLATGTTSGISFIVNVTSDLTKIGLHAGKLAKAIGEQLNGNGGGRPELAQGGGKATDKLAQTIANFPELVADQLSVKQ